MARIKNLELRESALNPQEYYPTWSFDEQQSTIDHFEIMWAYTYGEKHPEYDYEYIWYHGADATTYGDPTAYNPDARYEPPEKSLQVRCSVRAVARTYRVNDEDVPYWTCEWARKIKYAGNYIYPDAPDAPSVKLKKIGGSTTYNYLEASLNVDEYMQSHGGGTPTVDQIHAVQFELWAGNSSVDKHTLEFKSEEHVMVATVDFRIGSAAEYRVRCKVGRKVPYGVPAYGWSEWSPFSSTLGTPPPTPPDGITTIRAASSTSVYLAWTPSNMASTYDIEYTTNPDYFEGSNATTTVTGIQTTKYILTGLESGDEYYFRIRAVNDNGGSEWTNYKSVIIGKKPAAPTTWSSTTTVIVGDPLELYWVHNAQDGSWMKYAQVEIYYDDEKHVETVESDQKEDEDSGDAEKTHHFFIDTSKWPEGTTIKWRVRTSGITNEYGDWSIQREVKVFARPTLDITMKDYLNQPFDVLGQFPIYVEGFAGPKTQEPLGYQVTITALSSYETTDELGRPIEVNVGDSVMSRYITSKDELKITISASDVNLDDSQSYRLTVVVSMNSGLTAEASKIFAVSWVDELLEPDAGISIDYSDYTARIIPRCWGENGKPIPGVDLAVYRREFDGAFTEIASEIDSETHTLVVDPHPALDYARYRITATTRTTGAVSYYDIPAYPVKGKEVVIQWDEEWTNFDTDNPDRIMKPAWSGSMLKIKGNIDVSDNVTPQAKLVNYIGRTYPVSYYGTAVDSTSTWNMDVPKDDKDTLYTLRRLQTWTGDVYVREPSGSGYWANVAVSFSQTHKEVVIPVSLNITRVEGGM